jgi:hypothetical protein
MLRRVQHEVQTDEEDEGPGGSDDKLAVHLGNPNLNPNLGFFLKPAVTSPEIVTPGTVGTVDRFFNPRKEKTISTLLIRRDGSQRSETVVPHEDDDFGFDWNAEYYPEEFSEDDSECCWGLLDCLHCDEIEDLEDDNYGDPYDPFEWVDRVGDNRTMTRCVKFPSYPVLSALLLTLPTTFLPPLAPSGDKTRHTGATRSSERNPRSAPSPRRSRDRGYDDSMTVASSSVSRPGASQRNRYVMAMCSRYTHKLIH